MSAGGGPFNKAILSPRVRRIFKVIRWEKEDATRPHSSRVRWEWEKRDSLAGVEKRGHPFTEMGWKEGVFVGDWAWKRGVQKDVGRT